jgi:hypothetical protein
MCANVNREFNTRAAKGRPSLIGSPGTSLEGSAFHQQEPLCRTQNFGPIELDRESHLVERLQNTACSSKEFLQSQEIWCPKASY